MATSPKRQRKSSPLSSPPSLPSSSSSPSSPSSSIQLYEKVHCKTINDAVHGHIPIHPLINAIIDTPQFQRLRNIKQLGMADFVYPTACHNRFEHSIGTYHLAGKFLKILYSYMEPSVEKREERKKELLCVQIAALCHDLGHGPFSHLWEKFLNLNLDNGKWEHEEHSIQMLDYMLEEEITDKYSIRHPPTEGKIQLKKLFSDYNLDDNDIELIKNIIRGKKPVSQPEKHYLYQIVNNADNDIDVDKFDYICRDSMMLHLPVHFDMERIMLYAKIMPVEEGKHQICFRDKIIPTIADMFMARAVLHDKAYQHLKVKIIEEMMIDALELASATSINYLSKIKSTEPSVFVTFNDSLMDVIKLCHWGQDDTNLEKANHIINRISKRELYSLITDLKVENPARFSTKEINDNIRILCLQVVKNGKEPAENTERTPYHVNGEELAKDIGLIMVEIDIGKSHKDCEKPLENIYVFEKPKRSNNFDQPPPKKCNLDEITALLPKLKDPNIFQKSLKRKAIIVYKGEDQKILKLLFRDKDFIKKTLKDVFQPKCSSSSS